MTVRSDKKLTNSERVITSLIAGALAGAMAKTVIAPLDRTKIYFQTQNKIFTFPGVMDFLLKSYRESGFTSLWRGNSATMARVVPYAAIQYSSHEQFKHLLQVETNDQKAHPHRSFIAGSLAGLISTASTYPLDVARARMAVCSLYPSLSQVFIRSIHEDGFLSLYRGFTPTLCGVIPYADHYGNNDIHPLLRMLFGAIAGLFGQSASYPLDIVRRRMQTQHGYAELGIIGTLRKVIIEEGFVHGLYKGLSLNWVKGPIAVGISFTSFDMIHKFLLTVYIDEIESSSSSAKVSSGV
ncbi:solute carrier family 25-like protein [Euroglyphus maynei]|uniref:Solute carrier family 25-like protein n=1 Tax=Euroglyphus maynei TaxID=6958 RepID=A0A1Y3BDI8_EURMA|nr:solute carrier family 25-like protein [Euroglyphus maynei]